MLITVDRAEFLAAIKRATAIAPSDSPLDVLKGVLLETDSARKMLTVTSTNLEVSLVEQLPCSAQEDGALVYSARTLAEMLQRLPEDTVEISRKENRGRMTLASGGASYEVDVWDRGAFPKPDLPFPEDPVKVSGIPAMAQHTVFSTAQDKDKPLLRCVNLMFTSMGLRAAGSDGMCIVTAKGDDQSTGDISLLVPALSLAKLAGMCKDEDEFRVGTTGKGIVFFKEDFLFSARLMEGGYIDTDSLLKTITNSFTVLMFFAVVLTIGFYAGAPVLLRLFGASDATLPYALSYSRIYIAGSVFVLVVLGMNPFITTQGFAKTSMLTTVIGAVINIILDPILIFGFGLGVRGAAIATVLSQAVGAAWIIRFLTGKKTILRLRRDYLRPEKQIILPVLALGISSFVMLSTESLLSISFSSSLARYGGDVAVGAMTVITSASQLCTLPIQGICQGGQPVMSFNFGAGKKARVKEAFRFQLTLCGAYTCLFWLLMMLFPGAVAGIFTSDTALIQYTTWAMRIYMAGIFAMGFQIACQQSFMALGQAKVSLLLACLRKIILLIPLIFILPHVLPNPVFGVFLAEPVSDILAATITTITFFARFDKILDRGAARI